MNWLAVVSVVGNVASELIGKKLEKDAKDSDNLYKEKMLQTEKEIKEQDNLHEERVLHTEKETKLQDAYISSNKTNAEINQKNLEYTQNELKEQTNIAHQSKDNLTNILMEQANNLNKNLNQCKALILNLNNLQIKQAVSETKSNMKSQILDSILVSFEEINKEGVDSFNNHLNNSAQIENITRNKFKLENMNKEIYKEIVVIENDIKHLKDDLAKQKNVYRFLENERKNFAKDEFDYKRCKLANEMFEIAEEIDKKNEELKEKKLEKQCSDVELEMVEKSLTMMKNKDLGSLADIKASLKTQSQLYKISSMVNNEKSNDVITTNTSKDFIDVDIVESDSKIQQIEDKKEK